MSQLLNSRPDIRSYLHDQAARLYQNCFLRSSPVYWRILLFTDIRSLFVAISMFTFNDPDNCQLQQLIEIELINAPTHCAGNIVDLVLVRCHSQPISHLLLSSATAFTVTQFTTTVFSFKSFKTDQSHEFG